MRVPRSLVGPGALGVLAAVLLVLVVPGAARAHDGLRSADPAPGGRVVGTPHVVRLEFLSPPRPDPRTFVSVVGPGGRDIASGEPAVSGLGVTQRVAATRASGRYVVTYAVAAADGHLAQGSYDFELRVPAHPAASGHGADPALLLVALAVVVVVLVVVARSRLRPGATPRGSVGEGAREGRRVDGGAGGDDGVVGGAVDEGTAVLGVAREPDSR